MTCYQEITCPDCETKIFMLAYRYATEEAEMDEQWSYGGHINQLTVSLTDLFPLTASN
jgi:hypothetical protein